MSGCPPRTTAMMVTPVFLRRLRAEFGPGNPPVVFCTTETEMSAIVQAIETGAQEYIMKPFDEEILVGKFEQVGLL